EPLYKYVRLLDREAEDIEAGRLFYVAATRAESRLYLLGCVKISEDGVVRLPSKRSLLGLAWSALGESVRLPAAVVAEEAGRKPLPAGELRRLPSDFEVPRAPMAMAWKASGEGREDEGPPFDWAKEAVRVAGIVVHAWLQRIAEDELRGWDDKRVDALRDRFASDLQRRGIAPAELERAAALVVLGLKNAISDERGRWVLGPQKAARNEYRLRSRERSLRIDRVFEDASGNMWVVDYKASAHEGTGVEAFLDVQKVRYAAQLNAYAEALGGARRGLYFPLQKGWREW
ncbi:MAG: PD-(D/E)XK nuclease family protein, partial [Betaproteobacteria bacterium]|nr:PD-(D/E)XK nuclease family protein [Betaproteobacteria bacterium]